MPNLLRHFRTLLPLTAVLIAVAAPPIPSRVLGDMVIFKDGFVLQGKVIREKKSIVDPASGVSLELSEGFFMVYDGARQVLFSQAQLDRAVDDREFAPEKNELKSETLVMFPNPKNVPPIIEITDTGTFDDNWYRTFRFNTLNGQPYAIKQHLGMISPFCARVDASYNPKTTVQYRWSACYLTKELSPETVRDILQNHPSIKIDSRMAAGEQFARKLKIAHFLAQTGWLREAGQDLDNLAKEFPDEKEAMDTARKILKQLHGVETAKQLKRLYRGGQSLAFEQLLENYDDTDVPQKTQQDVRAIKDEYQTLAENLKLAKKYLTELPLGVAQPTERVLFEEAAKSILAEMVPSNVERLESFVTQAKQAERLKKEKKDGVLAPANLLAFAVSGWVMGNVAAESNVDVAQKLWTARQTALKYQATHDTPGRQKVLNDYLANKNAVIGVDEMAQIISLLPPPEPAEKIDRTVKEMKTNRPGQAKVTYHVQVPAEYSHGRPWPVLIVLAAGGQQAKEMLEQWSELANASGYVLAAPRWEQGLAGTYNYSADEHATVIETLLDLRRRYNVDSDKVFLFGFGRGADMAFDMGLSHPDLFAGVLPMSSVPGNYCWRYRRNAAYLPYYIVNGDKLPKNNFREFFNDWIPGGYPLLYNQYIGRGMEWFPAERELALDWMSRKERANPVSTLGTADRNFTTVRSTDNRFYWLSTDGIYANQLNEDGSKYNVNVLGAQMRGSCSKNQISVSTVGLKQVSVWLMRDRRGQSMVEFDKPVTVFVNLTNRWNATKVTPSLKVLLDDLYERGDKQRPCLARLDFDKP
jgi:pimeloyl-ACP methyl ester carboxylesterase